MIGLPTSSMRHWFEADVAVRGLHVERPLLEDLFVKLTGEGFDVVR